MIADNIAAIRRRIEAACVAAGREPGSVRLLPVSKTHPGTALREAYAAGCHRFAENKVQEAEAKAAELADLPDVSWAFVGHLQSNKAKNLVRFAAEFQGLDSIQLAVELDKRLQQAGRQLDVLIEVNTSGESSKFGVAPDEVVNLARQLVACDSLRPRGLMTVASPDRGEAVVCFERMRMAQARLRELGGDWDELSMGMSGDFELAIAHGATVVRIGSAIFGSRNYG